MQVNQMLDACLFAVSFWIAYELRASPFFLERFSLPPIAPFGTYFWYYLVLIPVSHGVDVDTVPAALLAGFWIVAQMASSAVSDGTWPAWIPRLALVQVTIGLLAGGAAVLLLKRPERMRVEWWNP